MPPEKRLGSNDPHDGPKPVEGDAFGLDRETGALLVAAAQALFPKLQLLENPYLFLKVFDDVLFMSVEPPASIVVRKTILFMGAG